MDNRTYRNFFAPFTESRTTFHYNLPCQNLLCLEKLGELTRDSYLDNDFPTPIKPLDFFPFYGHFQYDTDNCTVLYPGRCTYDKAYDHVLKKILWIKRLACCIPKNYKKGLRTLKKIKLEKTSKINKRTCLYLNLIKFEPIEAFVGDYNWLYTGGNIIGFEYYSDYWIIAPDEYQESTFLNAIHLDSTFTPIWSENITTKKFNLLKNQPVYQITCKTNSDAILFAVRQTDSISIKKLGNDCELEEVWNCTPFESALCKKILTSSDLSQDLRHLSTVNNDCQVTVYNVESGMSFFSYTEPFKRSQWSRVLFSKEAREQVYFADQNSFNIFDLRADSQSIFMYKPTAVINRCEKICNFFGSESRENIIYIATSHNLVELDIRSGKNIQRWTHMMKYAAQFGGTTQKKDEELIILQSDDSRELVGICNEGLLNDFPYCNSGPYVFPTVQSELENSHFGATALHHKIWERLDFKITGLHMICDNKGINNVFTVNGGGDIVVTKLRNVKRGYTRDRRDYRISHDTALGFQNLEKQCYHVQTEKKDPPMATYDVYLLLAALKNPDRETLRGRNSPKPISDHWPRYEMYAPESLYYRSGFLAESILPLWGVKTINHEEEEEEKRWE